MAQANAAGANASHGPQLEPSRKPLKVKLKGFRRTPSTNADAAAAQQAAEAARSAAPTQPDNSQSRSRGRRKSGQVGSSFRRW